VPGDPHDVRAAGDVDMDAGAWSQRTSGLDERSSGPEIHQRDGIAGAGKNCFSSSIER
jgi:hypothetical protein